MPLEPVLLLVLGAGVAAQEPALDFPQPRVELGRIHQQEEVEAVFPFRVGPRPVILQDLEVSCGCAQPRMLAGGVEQPLGATLAPGTSGEVRVKFRTSMYEGEKTARVIVHHDGGDPVVLRLRAEVLPIFVLRPRLVDFGKVRLKEGATATIEVWGIGPWQVKEWKRLPPGVEIRDTGRVREAEDGGQVRQLEVRLTAGAPRGALWKSAAAETSLLGGGKELEIFLTGTVVDRVECRPGDRLSFGLVQEGQGGRRLLQVLAAEAGTPIPAPEVQLDPAGPFRLVAVEEVEAGRRYHVVVDLDREAPPGRHLALLHLDFTGGMAGESREMKVVALVQAAP